MRQTPVMFTSESGLQRLEIDWQQRSCTKTRSETGNMMGELGGTGKKKEVMLMSVSFWISLLHECMWIVKGWFTQNVYSVIIYSPSHRSIHLNCVRALHFHIKLVKLQVFINLWFIMNLNNYNYPRVSTVFLNGSQNCMLFGISLNFFKFRWKISFKSLM